MLLAALLLALVCAHETDGRADAPGGDGAGDVPDAEELLGGVRDETALLNVTKRIVEEQLEVGVNVSVTVFVGNPLDVSITSVVVEDRLGDVFELCEGSSNTFAFKAVEANTTANYTYFVRPRAAGIQTVPGIGVNYTVNRTRHAEETGPYGEVYVGRHKGLVEVIGEWVVVVLAVCAGSAFWIWFQQREHTKREMILRAKGHR